jgi:beta-barrel assembly-enhancing protease
MRAATFVLSALLVAVPAHAQFGSLINKAQKAKEKADDLSISDAEERELGDRVSQQLMEKYGVFQDKDVTKYVSLVGGVVARESSRPYLNWKFIVLDTDGVNAFAAPGGIIHVTRGLLGLTRNEAELAGVLGHEITHVTAKHTVRAIEQSKAISMGSDAAGQGSVHDQLIAKLSQQAYHMLLDGEFSRDDENEADEKGVRLANKLGYDPHGLVEVLKKIDARNSGREDRNGLFASHPATKDRIAKMEKQIVTEKLNGKATVEARYAKNIHFEAKPVSELALSVDGAAGLAGGDSKPAQKPAEKKDDKAAPKEEEPKKKGGLLGKIGLTTGSQGQNTQTVASAGARGGVPDRDAKGGPVKTRVIVTVSVPELEAFKKGIV